MDEKIKEIEELIQDIRYCEEQLRTLNIQKNLVTKRIVEEQGHLKSLEDEIEIHEESLRRYKKVFEK